MLDLSEKKVKQNMFFGTLYKGLSMILSFIYVPMILFCLGEVKYGIWTTILNVLSWISHFDIGIGNGLRNKLVESLSDKNGSIQTKKYISSAYIMLGGIISIVIIIGCILSYFINWNNVFGVYSIDENLNIIMGLSIVLVSINFVLSLCKSVYYSLQENSKVGLMGIIQQLIMIFGVWVLMKFKNSSILVIALLYGCSEILVSLIFSLKLFKKDKCFIPNIKYYSKKEAHQTTSLGMLFFISQIASLILFSTDNLIISHFIGPAEVTSYSIVNKLFSVGTGMFTMLVAPYWSRTAAAKAENNYIIVKQSLKSMFKLFILGIFGACLLMVVFKPVAFIWLHQDLNYQKGLIFFMTIYSIIFMWNAIYSQIVNGLSLMKILVPVAVLQGVVNIPLSLMFLLKFDMGAVGVLLGTICATLISAIVCPIYIHKEIKNNI